MYLFFAAGRKEKAKGGNGNIWLLYLRSNVDRRIFGLVVWLDLGYLSRSWDLGWRCDFKKDGMGGWKQVKKESRKDCRWIVV